MSDYNCLTRLPWPGPNLWVVRHTSRRDEPGSELVTIDHGYADPYTAIEDLAIGTRPRWQRAVERARVASMDFPQTQPAHPFAAVALYFGTPWPVEHPWHERFEFFQASTAAVNPATVSDRVTQAPAGAEHVIVQTDGKPLCLCGGTGDRGEFPPCDANGIPDEDADCSRLVCLECGRVFRTDTGEVIKRITCCVHCHTAVAAFPQHELPIDHAMPYLDGNKVWRHLSVDGAGTISCWCGTAATPSRPPRRLRIV